MRTNEAAPTAGPVAAWTRFWFTPVDPIGLHAVRVAAGLLFLAWLLPLAGHRDALFGAGGWFDRQALSEAAALPDGPPKPLGWSVLYLGGGPAVVAAVYFGALVVFVLFTLGVWVRLTAVLTWVAVASFTAGPAAEADADALLPILALYLMVGYLLLGQRAAGPSWAARLLGDRSCRLLGPLDRPAEPSTGAAVALRLLQVHLAVVLVATGLHKLQFGDWWAGTALWYPLHPPMETSLDQVRATAAHAERYLMFLNAAGYAALAWQIGFPFFAWRRAGRLLVPGGAAVGWAGAALIYDLPLYGPAVLVGCLAFVPPETWRRLIDRVSRSWPRGGGYKAGPVATRLREGEMSRLAGLLVMAATAVAGCAPVPSPVAEGEPEAEPQSFSAPADSDDLRHRIDRAVESVRRRELSATHGFWTVFHGVLGLGPGAVLRDPGGRPVRAIDYVLDGGELRGLRFLPTRHGLDVQTGPTFVGQGHQDQFIAEMAQWGVPADRPVRVAGREYQFLDFVRHSQMRARVTAGQELSWAVVAVGQYLGTDLEWVNEAGERLRFEDLVRYELDAPVESAACGGTHRLFGLSWAYRLHRGRGGRETGAWAEVPAKVEKYRDRARALQNPDGSFSTSYFSGWGDVADPQLRVGTTGHTLEWLALALGDDELRRPWVRGAARALADLLTGLHDEPVEPGALYHAVHGLLIYRTRVYGDPPPTCIRPLLPPPAPADWE